MNDDLELTPEEKAEFERLPREASPSPLVWERIVRTLRTDGTLQSGAGARRSPAGPRAAASLWAPRWAIAGATMAASLILFVSGMVLGHWMATMSTERAFQMVRENDSAQLAQHAQEAGTAYVSALVALAELQATSERHRASATSFTPDHAASEIRQGKEAALGALYGATFELAKLTPGDSDISRILEILEERRLGRSTAGGERRTAWY
jgi:hypothetical protein